MIKNFKNITGEFMGEERKYTFEALTYKEGALFFHGNVSVLTYQIEKVLPIAQKLLKSYRDGAFIFDEEMALAAHNLTSVFTPEIYDLFCAKLLKNFTVEIDGEVHTADDEGYGSYSDENPLEIYAALFNALCCNYAKLIPFFMGMLDGLTQQDDNEQETSH